MYALTFHGIRDIRYELVGVPVVLAPTDVLVRVNLCSICGSDLHVYHAREKGLDHGTAMGHEFTGEIVERGTGVKSFRVGDRVMSPFTTNCGNCFYCRIGLTCRCVHGQLFGWVQNGQGLPGGQAEIVRVPMADSTLLKVPDGVSAEEALMLGDIISTGFFCAHQSGIHPGETQVVIGCGPVGLMSILGAREYGAEKLFAVDSVDARLKRAKFFGAVPINMLTEDPVEVIKAHTEGRGADSIMEAVGNESAGKLAYNLLRPGGTISTVGVCTDPGFSFSPTQAYDKNITFKVGRCPAKFYMDQLIPIVQQRKYDFTSIITHRIKLSEGPRGYEVFDKKEEECLKVVMSI